MDNNKKSEISEKIKNSLNKLREDIKSTLIDTSGEITDIYEDTEKQLAETSAASGEEILDNIQETQKELISAESLYTSEKLRIEQKRKAQSEEIARAEYQEKLASASDANKAAKLMREENLRLEKAADDEYLAGLKDAAEKEIQIRESEFSALKQSLDLGYITQSEYYSQLAALRDKYFKEDSDEWVKYTKQINSYHTKSLNDLKNYISEAQNDLDKLQESISDKLSGYSKLYTKKTITYKKAGENGRDLVFTSTSLNDLSEQTEMLREYADALEAVKKRGELPEGFFDELRSMRIDEGMDFAKALLDASDSEFEEYINSYAEKQAEIARISAELTESEAAEMINTISAELEKYYDSIPEGFFECGKLSGENFTSAFISSLTSLSEGLGNILPYSAGGFAAGNSIQSNSYSSVYNLYSTAQTASEQLREARAASELERMRGGY